MIDFLELSRRLESSHIENRRFLHKHPELGAVLPETTEYIKKKLRELGCHFQEIPSGGLLAEIGTGTGKAVLLRADMDALPMEEQSGLPFSSMYPGRAHTCGHDLHTAFLLGAASLLKEKEEELSGTVKLMFQAGEETLEGARTMIQAGVLENPEVNAAIGIHVQPTMPLGYLNFPKGTFLASSDTFEIRIHGKGGHGGLPHLSIDPINITAHLILALQSFQVKEIAAGVPAVLNVCQVESGNATNIVPETAKLMGTIRTYDDSVRKKIKGRMLQIIEETARMYGGTGELIFTEQCPCTTNDNNLVDFFSDSLIHFGTGFITERDYKMQVSDDFGFVSQRVPSVMFIIGCSPEGRGQGHNHSPSVIYNEKVLVTGAALMAHCAWDWLKNH